jgi:pimeloyl-ACP methyl ester carboxylesterase
MSVNGTPEETPAAQPFWFGPPQRPLFGWYHAARASVASRTGVVLCNAFGHEAMSSHRAYRRLAIRLAEGGHPVLRFDYDGTGDSAGGSSDPDRVQAWLNSIELATRELQRLSGAPRLVLFGTRFGALLALAHAAQRPIDGLVLLGPPASGKAWVREMSALQSLRRMPPRPAGMSQDPEEAIVGFALDAATRADLSKIDPRAFAARPAARVLVIARDDVPSAEENLAKRLRALGAEVKVSNEPGYAGMVPEDPVRTVVPEKMFDSIAAWLAEESGDKAAQPVSWETPPLSGVATPAPNVREEAVCVAGDLFGIVTEPSSPERLTRTAVLLLNIGANHHVGSNRIYVTMARTWAGLGYRVLRLDFSGVGDSAVRPGGKDNDIYSQKFFDQTRSALDWVANRGSTRFVLMGICSGAYASYHTAVADPRVSGVVMVNTATFHWNEGDSLEIKTRSGGSTRFYLEAILWPSTWKRIVSGDVNVPVIVREMGKRVGARAKREAESLLARLRQGEVAMSDIRSGFRKLSARGTRAFLVFGSFEVGIDIIEEHLGPNAKVMRDAPSFRMELMEGVDHTFTPLWAQEQLVRMLTEHLLTQFSDARRTSKAIPVMT